MLTALAILAGAFGYMQIGRLWGGWRHNLYLRMKRNREKTISHLVNFPIIYSSQDFYSSLSLAEDRGREKYQTIFAFLWPFAAAWVGASLLLTGASALASGVIKFFLFPERALGAGYGTLKSLAQKRTKTAELPAPQLEEDDECPNIDELRTELNVALFDQEEASTRVSAIQEKIFLEEARLQGSYREAALPEPDKK